MRKYASPRLVMLPRRFFPPEECCFGVRPSQDYLITDESTLRDFTDFGSAKTSLIWSRITEIYAINRSDAPSERLVDIFAAIERRKSIQ